VGGREFVDELAPNMDLTVGDELVTGNHSEGRSLSTTARSEQATVRSTGDGEVNIIDGDRRAIALCETLEANRAI
jgi:hypothetical protein